MVATEIFVCIYIFNTCVGVVVNIVFAYKIWTSKVPRNPLLIGMIISDLSVCAISCPMKTYRILCRPNLGTFASVVIFDFFESLPASSATLSMMCIALDRYCVVKKFQPLNRKITRERIQPYIAALTWVIASFMVMLEAVSRRRKFSWFFLTTIVKVTVVNCIPVLTVMMSHLFLYLNLTALSLTARARHGELPLPMPIIQRKKPDTKSHVIIVTGMSKQDDKDPAERETVVEPTVPSSLRHRKRLGCFMLLMAFCFFFMWGPFTTCELLNIVLDDGVSYEIIQFTQCLGLLHSGLSPLLSMASMDRDWNKGLFVSCRRLDKLTDHHHSPSSTNEDALGPFNPRLVRPHKKANYNRRSSSVLIY